MALFAVSVVSMMRLFKRSSPMRSSPCCYGKSSSNIINSIIVHLKLTIESERPPPPRVVQQERLIAAEESGVYF